MLLILDLRWVSNATLGDAALVLCTYHYTHKTISEPNFIIFWIAQQFTYGVVSEGFFCGKFAEFLRKFCRKYVLLRQERVRKFCGKFAQILWKFAENFLEWPLPERPHKCIAELLGGRFGTANRLILANCSRVSRTEPLSCESRFGGRTSLFLNYLVDVSDILNFFLLREGEEFPVGAWAMLGSSDEGVSPRIQQRECLPSLLSGSWRPGVPDKAPKVRKGASSRGPVNREVQTVNWDAGKKGAVETGVKRGLKKGHKPWIRGKKGAQTVNPNREGLNREVQTVN